MAYVVLDLETTGLDAQENTIIEVGAVRFDDPRALQQPGSYETLQLLVNPHRKLDPFITCLTGIQDSDLEGQASWNEVRAQVQAFLSAPATHLVAHNVQFEKAFLTQHAVDLDPLTLLDTQDLAFMVFPRALQLNLAALCFRCGVDPGRSHRAYDDALATAKVFGEMLLQVDRLPDASLQQLLAHSPRTGWGFRDVWADQAARRHLAELDRNEPMVLPQSAYTAQTEHLEERLSSVQPSFFPLAPRAPQTRESRPVDSWSAHMVQALEAGKSQVLVVNPGLGRREAVALAAYQWAAAHDRRVLLCLPHCENDLGQHTVLEALAQTTGNAPSFLPDPSRYLDLDRLNVWKAGRSLDSAETRLLGKILHWTSSTPTASQESLFLRHDLDNLVLWPQLACQPIQFTDSDPDPLQTVPSATRRRDSLITLMDHATLLRTLQEDPDCAGEFDAIVIDDIWHLIQKLPQFVTATQSLHHARYFLDRLQDITDPARDGDAAQWLSAIHGMANRLSALGLAQETVSAALLGFVQQVDRLSQSEMEQSDTRFTHALAKSVHDLSGNPLFQTLVDQWHPLARSLRKLSVAGTAVLDTIPPFDADEEPVQGRYVRQLQGWLAGADAFRQGVDNVLHPSDGTLMERRERVPWVEIRKKADACKFNVTQYCGEDFWQERVLGQCTPTLFLHVSQGTPRQGGYLTQRLGITHLPQARLDPKAAKAADTLILNPRNLPEPMTNDFKSLVETLLPKLAPQITGNAVFMMGNTGQRKASAAALRKAALGNSIHILEDELDSTAIVLEALADSRPTIFCCTTRTMQAFQWETIPVQCVLMERLPFAPFQDPLLDHQSRYASLEGKSNKFYDQTLPICAYSLMRAADLLHDTSNRPTALVLLDARLVTKRYGPKLRQALPSGLWKHPPVENLPGELQSWLGRT